MAALAALAALPPQALTFLCMGAAVLATDALTHHLAGLLSPPLAAAADTLLGHGALAGLQYCLAAALGGAPQARALGAGALCALVSAGMDADHFVQARSLSLHAALALPARPFAHSVAFLLAAVAAAAAAAQRGLLPPWAPHLLATALGGHQLRDSLRRGLWAGPAVLGSTPPTPYALYWVAMAALPLALAPALRALQREQQQQTLLPL
jgi:hypothetical protein